MPAATRVPLGLGSKHAHGEMRHRKVLHLWVLALLGLIGMGTSLWCQSLDFFHSWTELSHLVVDETPGTGGQSSDFSPINLAIIDHILLCMGSQNAFLTISQEPVTPWENPISTGNKNRVFI